MHPYDRPQLTTSEQELLNAWVDNNTNAFTEMEWLRVRELVQIVLNGEINNGEEYE
jgi:hypothetical protein